MSTNLSFSFSLALSLPLPPVCLSCCVAQGGPELTRCLRLVLIFDPPASTPDFFTKVFFLIMQKFLFIEIDCPVDDFQKFSAT